MTTLRMTAGDRRRLKELWAAGRSADQIGRALHCPVDDVLAELYRTKLLRGRPLAATAPAATPANAPARGVRVEVAIEPVEPRGAAIAPVQVPPAPAETAVTKKTEAAPTRAIAERGRHEWSDDDIERLKQMWSDGRSAGEIGRALGVSRNAVLGKLHRKEMLNQWPHAAKVRRQVRARSERARPVHQPAAAARAKVVSKPAPAVTVRRRPMPEASSDRAAERNRIVTLEPTMRFLNDDRRYRLHCAWIAGDVRAAPIVELMVCGRTCANAAPYCPDHCRIAYTTAAAVREAREVPAVSHSVRSGAWTPRAAAGGGRG